MSVKATAVIKKETKADPTTQKKMNAMVAVKKMTMDDDGYSE